MSDSRIAVYVDSELHVLRVELVCEGGARSCSVLASKIIRIGLHVGAAAILLVHIRPEGGSKPSHCDREAAARLSSIARDLDMTLLDAWLVAGEDACSMIGA
jgi:DNA repair protein RadC